MNHWHTTLEADSFRNAQALKDFELICSRELYQISLYTGPAILPALLIFLLRTVVNDFV